MQPRKPNARRPAILVACFLSLCPQPLCRAQTATILWKFPLPFREFYREATSSAAVAPDGTIYQATFQGDLFALTPQGAAKWRFKAGREIKSSPAIGADGTIYFGSHDKKLYALKPDGAVRWTFLTGGEIISSPAIAADGT